LIFNVTRTSNLKSSKLRILSEKILSFARTAVLFQAQNVEGNSCVVIIMYVFGKPKLLTAFLPADVSTVEPPPDLAQDRRPTVRTNSLPHVSPMAHDLKTLASSDYAYTYPGMGAVRGGCHRLGT
jgi:hypothetical protein